jgi:hypothetical protein
MVTAPPKRGPELLPAPQKRPASGPVLAPTPRNAPATPSEAVPESNAMATRSRARTPVGLPLLPSTDPFSNAVNLRIVTPKAAPPQSHKSVIEPNGKPAPTSKVPAPGASATGEKETGPAKEQPQEAPPARAKGKAEGPAGKGAEHAGAPAGAEGAEVAGAAGGGGPEAGPTLLMPEPPAAPSAAAQKRMSQVQQSAALAATVHADLPTAETQAGQARGAVTPPAEETNTQASADLIAALDAAPPPSSEIEELCQRIYQVIRSKRPPDEESLVKAEPDKMAAAAGGELNQTIQGDTKRVEGSYDGLQQQQKGQPGQPGQPPVAPPATVDAAPRNAAAAAPDPVSAENVSLQADVAANQERMRDAGMESEPAKLVQIGPIAEARAAQDELTGIAERGPAKVLAEQQKSLGQAQTDMADLQKTALQALQASRRGTIGDNREQQTDMVGSEEKLRATVGKQGREIFVAAQNDVRKLLQPLSGKAMKEWTDGVAVLSTQFKAKLSKVEAWIRERHKGGWGSVVKLTDDIFGYPAWITLEYDQAEKDFGDGVCTLVRKISKDVNAVVAACEAIIANTNKRIDDLFSKLPSNLQDWARGEQVKFKEQLDGLRTEAKQTRDTFNKDLSKRAGQAVQDVRTQIHALRQEAKGAIGRAVDAINRFLDDPAKAILEGLLELVGIPPADFWALVSQIQQVIKDIADDPVNFTNNLLAALRQGFSLFFDNIVDHLLKGMLDWLLSGLKGVGVELPKDLSLKSIITFFLQLMGITWPRIRKLLAKHIGQENVALIEKAWSIISTLIEQGPQGIFEMIKDKLDPKNILDMVIQAAKDYLIEALIKQATITILSLFNPAEAIYQALKLLYKVLKWIFNNAARIFRLVETVVKGIADIIAGNIGGMAKAIEKALAGLLVTVIDFIADYLGIGDLPEKIKQTIEKFQTWIEGILDKVIGWLAAQGRALLKAMGLGKEDKKEGGKYDGEIGKVVNFTAGREHHRLRIVTKGNDAIVMLASEEKPLSEHLDDYEKKAAEVKDEKKQTELLGLISEARQLQSELDKNADSMTVIAKDPGQQSATIASADKAVENSEERLAKVIQSIRDGLGLKDPPEVIKAKVREEVETIGAELAGMDELKSRLEVVFTKYQSRGLKKLYLKAVGDEINLFAEASAASLMVHILPLWKRGRGGCRLVVQINNQPMGKAGYEKIMWNAGRGRHHAEQKLDLMFRHGLFNEYRRLYPNGSPPRVVDIAITYSPCHDRCEPVILALQRDYPFIEEWNIAFAQLWGSDPETIELSREAVRTLASTPGIRITNIVSEDQIENFQWINPETF